MQKMARDLMKKGPTSQSATAQEKVAIKALQESISAHMSKGASKKAAWDASWELVYGLSEVHMKGILDRFANPQARM
jgi:hypothetical protein